jgi:dephospho-CoA kinase
MKKAFLVTGVSGSGKTVVCEHLIADGYEAYNIEDIDGMFKMYHKDTGKIFKNYDNADPKKIKNSRWICNVNKLKKLLKMSKILRFLIKRLRA